MTYAAIEDIRAIDKLDDVTFYPDEVVEAALRQADELIDRYTGTSWTFKPFTVVTDGNNSRSLLIPVLFPRTIASASLDGEPEDPSEWVLYDHGRIVRADGYWRFTPPGRNVTIAGTAGATETPPEEISWAARTLAANVLIQRETRVPDRALAVQSEFGQVLVAQAGSRPDRPTEFPAVNAVLNHYRHRPPTAW